MTLRSLVGVAAIFAISILAGVAASLAVIGLANVVLPPFREEIDDDTMREYGPVAVAYLTGAVTTGAVLLIALRRLLREDV